VAASVMNALSAGMGRAGSGSVAASGASAYEATTRSADCGSSCADQDGG
jgi:hypothetical protein